MNNVICTRTVPEIGFGSGRTPATFTNLAKILLHPYLAGFPDLCRLPDLQKFT